MLSSVTNEEGESRTSQYQAVPLEDPGGGDEEEEAALLAEASLDDCRKWIGDVFIKGDTFQSLIAVVILGNAAVIGLETDLKSYDWLWSILEDSFLLIFFLELGLRIYYFRSRIFSGQEGFGNFFDAALVITGVVDFIVTKVFRGDLGQLGFILKACRLLRIARLFRLFKMIKPLYMLASGFLESSVAVFWVTVLCGLGLYICAIFLTRTLGQFADQGKDYEVYGAKFGSIGLSMLTLFELMSNPDLESMEEIMLRSPGMMIFFIIFIIYGSFAMLSILTGVISEGMIEKGNNHKDELRFQEERRKDVFVTHLRQHFEISDTDGDGTMTRKEFHEHLPEMISMFHDHGFFYNEVDLQMVFDLVDFDKGGTVEVEEFLQGMTSFTANVSDLPLQFLRLQSNLMIHMNSMKDVFMEKFSAMEQAQKNMDAKLNVLTLKNPSGPYQRSQVCC